VTVVVVGGLPLATLAKKCRRTEPRRHAAGGGCRPTVQRALALPVFFCDPSMGCVSRRDTADEAAFGALEEAAVRIFASQTLRVLIPEQPAAAEAHGQVPGPRCPLGLGIEPALGFALPELARAGNGREAPHLLARRPFLRFLCPRICRPLLPRAPGGGAPRARHAHPPQPAGRYRHQRGCATGRCAGLGVGGARLQPDGASRGAARRAQRVFVVLLERAPQLRLPPCRRCRAASALRARQRLAAR